MRTLSLRGFKLGLKNVAKLEQKSKQKSPEKAGSVFGSLPKSCDLMQVFLQSEAGRGVQ